MSSKLRPAVWGGLFIGVLSSLPFVSGLNACCCLWVIAGGVLTSYLLQESHPTAIQAGDGAVAGLLAGVIGAVITTILSSLLAAVGGASMDAVIQQMLERGGEMPPGFSDALERARNVPAAAWVAVSFAFNLVIFPIFGLLGGLLGVAVFKKTPPPPPPGTVEILPPE